MAGRSSRIPDRRHGRNVARLVFLQRRRQGRINDPNILHSQGLDRSEDGGIIVIVGASFDDHGQSRGSPLNDGFGFAKHALVQIGSVHEDIIASVIAIIVV
eukprot:scaffold34932_cov114-Amphora_coffeaeformis.AAC.1